MYKRSINTLNWMVADAIHRFNQTGIEGNYSPELKEAIQLLKDLKENKNYIDMFADMIEFHTKFEHVINSLPTIPSAMTARLRSNLIEEEAGELLEAIEDCNISKIADGCADLVYVVIGTAVSFGIDLPAVWKVVHQSNMNKPFLKRKNGKTLKGTEWKHPDIQQILDNQKPIIHCIGEI